jgi:Regulator of ribonuclease activity B
VGIRDLFGRPPRRFVTRPEFEANLAKQLQLNLRTLGQLRSHGLTAADERKIEFFFFTDSGIKGAALATALASLSYQVEHRPSTSEGADRYVVTGWTLPIRMEEGPLSEWTRKMCLLGFEHDCDFDGWGTHA